MKKWKITIEGENMNEAVSLLDALSKLKLTVGKKIALDVLEA